MASLLDAKFDEFENSPSDGTAVLTEIVHLATTWLTVAEEEAIRPATGACSTTGRRRTTGGPNASNEDQASVGLAVADYEAALGDLIQAPDQLVSPSEVREELAAAMQVLGVGTLFAGVVITLGLTIWAYVAAPVTKPAWPVDDGLWGVSTALMLIASVLWMGSLIRNPALPGAAKQAAKAQARGVYGITRHPMLWAFAI